MKKSVALSPKPFWDFYTRKIVYALLILLFLFIKIYLRFYSFVFRKKRNNGNYRIKKIAAVWYYPYDFPAASYTRLGRWKSYFEQEGIVFDNYHVGTIKDIVKIESATWTIRYLLYIKYTILRFYQFHFLRKYDLVWIDRWYLPYYPSKSPYWERAIKKITGKLVIDSTDGSDYEGNPELILSIFSLADRITVAFETLYDFYNEKFPGKVYRFNYTIIEDKYLIKENWALNDPIKIGWMGSPNNFNYLKKIEPELEKVAQRFNIEIIIICRINVKLNIKSATIEYHDYGSNYEELIKSFDIGLVPMLTSGFSTKGKIAMKHQEFLLCQIPQVCSPVGISEHAVDGEHCLIADEVEDWSGKIINMITDDILREKVAKEGRKLCLKHYTYKGQWDFARKALLNWNI